MRLKIAHIEIPSGQVNRVELAPNINAPADGATTEDNTLIKYVNADTDAHELIMNKYWNFQVQGFLMKDPRPNLAAVWTNVNGVYQWEWNHDDLMVLIRAERNEKLIETDWAVLPDNAFTVEQENEIKTYRQNLRDVPAGVSEDISSSDDVAWPTKPDFL